VKQSVVLFVGVVTAFVADVSVAQSFRLMRFDEEYVELADSLRKGYKDLKYIPLSKANGLFVSIGGEVRYEYALFRDEDWGRRNVGKNKFLLQRYNLHADVHLGKTFRIFGQLRSALEDGRKTGPRPVDEDALNIQNVFLDAKLPITKTGMILLRIGRQEINYGSGRLISVREGPNARLYFNGMKVVYTSPAFAVDGFVMNTDSVFNGVFDNKRTKGINLWGLYATTSFPNLKHLDLYYLGKHNEQSIYEQGRAKEQRHTVGARVWGQLKNWRFDLEGAYQLGKFGKRQIGAYMASLDVGYQFTSKKWKPLVGIRTDYFSGDRRIGDSRLQTFNPIYPKGGYFGFNPQVGAANLIDFHPYWSVEILKGLSMLGDVICIWRYSLEDGIYRPSGVFNFPGGASRKRYIGTSYLVKLTYSINSFLSTEAGCHYFKTGAFAKDIISNPKNAFLSNYRIVFKF
jgi:hypothetical protein